MIFRQATNRRPRRRRFRTATSHSLRPVWKLHKASCTFGIKRHGFIRLDWVLLVTRVPITIQHSHEAKTSMMMAANLCSGNDTPNWLTYELHVSARVCDASQPKARRIGVHNLCDRPSSQHGVAVHTINTRRPTTSSTRYHIASCRQYRLRTRLFPTQ
jgi:hypothetical protein